MFKFIYLGSALCLLGGLTGSTGKHAALVARDPDTVPHLTTLIVGGGPNKKNNQAGIESNVRYVARILPPASGRRILFADGDTASQTVYCEGPSNNYYREPHIPTIDGPSTNDSVRSELETLGGSVAAHPGSPALLFFTGHGGEDSDQADQNNYYCTWKDGQLSVTELAKGIRAIPKSSPIVLVMVECFSGAFGNLLFDGGKPDGSLLNRPICGFFASTNYRMSAGCTSEVNEADYKDFTGYFFAALTGTDRMGKAVSGADYNHDGKITMDEAFAYTLIHDDSIDTPVCTSDVFLRRYVTTADPDCFQYPYASVYSWGTHAQKAALDALRFQLGFSSEDMSPVYREFKRSNPGAFEDRVVRLTRLCRLYKTVVLTHQLLSSTDAGLKGRFRALIQQEHSNPISADLVAMLR